MTRVYLDPATAVIENGGAADPGSLRSLRYLVEAGHRVVLVADRQEPPTELAALADDVVRSVPARPDGQSWYLTADVSHCQGASARLRTVLIGGTPPSGSIHRCDAVARDVQAAVMEILAAEAMPAEVHTA